MAIKFCLDANVLIEAWQKYYNPKFCPDYWDILSELGIKGKIFIPELVHMEITRTDDDLSKWLRKSQIPISTINEPITGHIRRILAKYPQLVDSKKGRSLADPWVIAHALHENATVVTKEQKVTAINARSIKIPNVCEEVGIRWINDFQFIDELDIKFRCSIS